MNGLSFKTLVLNGKNQIQQRNNIFAKMNKCIKQKDPNTTKKTTIKKNNRLNNKLHINNLEHKIKSLNGKTHYYLAR